MKWVYFSIVSMVLVGMIVADGELWQEDDHEVLIRNQRGTKNKGNVNVATRMAMSKPADKTSVATGSPVEWPPSPSLFEI
ncbi:unnamed protein product [Acanthoscelides obtectus]|uniref:Uncharacterized protein n=1 Tax=Acanthoscelides obtectus TaxID=200917 RepID=A0A9P0P301_ACAOB|nr:unnamed protein product [Acanthoscelides obtectus]CAK1666902.1 hypothetical protein AOBTE_LOCUS25545 [Acanthoscelides obtectus]